MSNSSLDKGLTTPTLTIGTHDGPFHSDDVLAVAILTTIYKNSVVVRTRDKSVLANIDYVVDVGGVYDHITRRFDHHMPKPPTSHNGHVYSSAGLIWEHYSKTYLRAINMPKKATLGKIEVNIHDQVTKIIRSRWIVPIDCGDNGLSSGLTTISEIVSAMAPIDGEKTPERYNAQFLEAVKIVAKIFERACFHAADHCLAKVAFRNSNKSYLCDNRILIVDTEVRNFGVFGSSPVHFVIYPDINKSFYAVRPIYRHDSRIYKTPFPKETLGLTKDELTRIGILDITFVHHSGFVAHAETEQAAIALCHASLLAEPIESIYY